MVEEPYRSTPETDELKTIRTSLFRAIGKATRVVLYGVSISGLDVEFGQVLASALHGGSVHNVIVVKPTYPDVAERIATIVNDAERSTTHPLLRAVGSHISLGVLGSYVDSRETPA
ncbi:MAG TPA: hypothetical protein VFQ61_39365 [Polyangiaceae bacterium]|nr:hypothetical protein [Polyangiaceae bacterium]